MNLKYKVVEVWPADHIIVVRYFTDLLSEHDLKSVDMLNDDYTPVRCRTDVSISVPIPEPSADELEKLIIRNAPVMALEKLELLQKEVPDMAVSKTLLGKVKNFAIPVAEPVDVETIEAYLKKTKTKTKK